MYHLKKGLTVLKKFMQSKCLLFSVLAMSPSLLVAQAHKSKKVHSNGKKIAMKEPGVGNVCDSMAAQAIPFALKGAGKPAAVPTQKNAEAAKANTGQTDGKPVLKIAASMARPLDRVAVANDRFKAVPLAGEVAYYGHMNNFVLDYVKRYMSSCGTTLRSVKGRGAKGTFKSMETVLNKYEIPQELKYLAVIESALNKNAKSPVGAVGYWQFMESTAKMMGLTVNGTRDDRTDLLRSTHAAAKYLSYLYDQLDDWLLVVAAYNSGPRPVINAMQRTGKDDFWSIKKYLPQETQNHVLAFVATATIMERLNHFLMPGLPGNFDWASLNVASGIAAADATAVAAKPKNPLLSKFTETEIKSMAIIRIKAPLDLEVVAQTLNTDRRQLGKWNYDYFDYLETYKTGNVYNFRLPKDKLDMFLEKLDYMEQLSKKMMQY
ncbi:MAG: lytic transglycosylase domain-containing protein [Edaphocola sp.]